MFPVEQLAVESPVDQVTQWMLPPEKKVPGGFELVGTIGETIAALHPEAEGIPLGDVISLALKTVQDSGLVAPSIFAPDSRFFLTGSDAKRVLGGTPEGWYEPGILWQKLIHIDSNLVNDQVVRTITAGGRNDTDVRFVMGRGVTMEDVATVVRKGTSMMPCAVTVELIPHGSSKQIRLCVSNQYHVDLGALWDYRRVDPYVDQVRDDTRMSHYLPWRQFGTSVNITDGDSLVVKRGDRENFWFAPHLNNGIWRADRAQALLAWLRSKATDYWWPPRKEMDCASYYSPFRDTTFWDTMRQNSAGREERLADRASEIAASTLLLLTVYPNIGWQMKTDGVLGQLRLGHLWDGTGISPAPDYMDRLRDGTLNPHDSSPFRLAENLGISLSELVKLCTPRELE